MFGYQFLAQSGNLEQRGQQDFQGINEVLCLENLICLLQRQLSNLDYLKKNLVQCQLFIFYILDRRKKYYHGLLLFKET